MIHIEETDPIGEMDPSFPYRDVTIRRGLDVNDMYELQSEIGRGKFGTVYRCRERCTGLSLAAKFVGTPRKEDRRNVEREVEIMRCLQHPRLIQLYDAFDNGKMMCLILELIEGGELFERVIDDDFVLTEKSCTVFMRQICEGVSFIHAQNILHLDMKPENILCLTKTGNRIKVIDFGLARKYDPKKKLQVLFGTPEFVAPEVVNFDQIGFGTDMWSVGVICYVLLSGLSPFMGETDIETMANVTIAKYDFDDEAFSEISDDAKDFISKLLMKEQDQRMSASQCLTHPWLRRKPLPPPQPKTEELDVAKDNLRIFVERWTDHPNSPYLFDTSCQSISLCYPDELQQLPSQHSLHGMSPSPCGSLPSSPDSVIESDLMGKSPQDTYIHYTFDKNTMIPNQHIDGFHFGRRSSDSSCLMRRNDYANVNLVDEIRKLSDKLFKMAAAQSSSDLSNNNSKNFNFSSQCAESETTHTSNSYEVKFETVEESNASSFSTSTPVYVSKLTIPVLQTGKPGRPTASLRMSESSSFPSPEKKQKGSEAPQTRTKFKISNLNREVPNTPFLKMDSNNTSTFAASNSFVRSNFTEFSERASSRSSTKSVSSRHSSGLSNDTLPSTPIRSPPCSPLRCQSSASSHSAPSSPSHSPKQTPERDVGKDDLTKDLLLHLLHKWDDKQGPSAGGPVISVDNCRKAISMEWSEVELTMESLGQRTRQSLGTHYESSKCDYSKTEKRRTLSQKL